MREEIIHYIWQNHFTGTEFLLSDGRKCSLLFPGYHNLNSGPDFENGIIKIDEIIFSGNIEIHLKSSDWKKHGHHEDPSYDNIILHVVLFDDEIICDRNHNSFPTLVINIKEFEKTTAKIQTLIKKNKSKLICTDFIPDIPSSVIQSEMDKMLNMQIVNKGKKIEEIRNRCFNDWNETAWILTARTMGLKLNSDAMEMLAYSISWKTLLANRDNITRIEAMLFGQAGLLPEHGNDEYSKRLIAEYILLQKKYSLSPIDKRAWKFAPIRPTSRPEIRLSQLASIIHKHDSLINLFDSIKDPSDLFSQLQFEPDSYWMTHKAFGKSSPKAAMHKAGKALVNTLLINAIVPFQYYRASVISENDKPSQIIKLLEHSAAEKNSIIDLFIKAGFPIVCAADSQAALYLYKNYCIKKQCLKCGIFNFLIKTDHAQ